MAFRLGHATRPKCAAYRAIGNPLFLLVSELCAMLCSSPCQSASNLDPRSACKIDPFAESYSRCLKRQLSLPVSMISQ